MVISTIKIRKITLDDDGACLLCFLQAASRAIETPARILTTVSLPDDVDDLNCKALATPEPDRKMESGVVAHVLVVRLTFSGRHTVAWTSKSSVSAMRLAVEAKRGN